MNPLLQLLELPESERLERGLRFTPLEIKQQPETWLKTYQKVLSCGDDLADFTARAGLKGDESRRPGVFLIGAGTSDYIGRALTSVLRQSWQCEVMAAPSTDLLIELDDYLLPGKPYLWISFSRSGDSSEGVAVIESALKKYPHIYHLLITCNPQSKMARGFTNHNNVYCLTLDDQVNDRGLAMTSSFSNMVVAGLCLAHLADLREYATVIEQLSVVGEDFLEKAALYAKQISADGIAKICFLGTGPLQAVAVESALKVMELTAGRIHSLAESYLGIRHGPLSAIDEETLVVAHLSGDERRRGYELDLLKEIKNKDLTEKIVVVSSAQAQVDWPFRTLWLENSKALSDYCRPPVDVMLGQLLGLFLSLECGLQPDLPSPTGAISRVVTQVKIY